MTHKGEKKAPSKKIICQMVIKRAAGWNESSDFPKGASQHATDLTKIFMIILMSKNVLFPIFNLTVLRTSKQNRSLFDYAAH